MGNTYTYVCEHVILIVRRKIDLCITIFATLSFHTTHGKQSEKGVFVNLTLIKNIDIVKSRTALKARNNMTNVL